FLIVNSMLTRRPLPGAPDAGSLLTPLTSSFQLPESTTWPIRAVRAGALTDALGRWVGAGPSAGDAPGLAAAIGVWLPLDGAARAAEAGVAAGPPSAIGRDTIPRAPGPRRAISWG